MSVRELDRQMEKAINDFAEVIQAKYDEFSDKPATEADIVEVSRQCFYTLQAMRGAIVEHLERG